jgi:hypothetical protein
VDLDGDGTLDVLSGSFPGTLHLFAGSDDGHAAGRTLKDPDGEDLTCGSAVVPYAVDWDADGDLDLLVGELAGYVYLLENTSSGKALTFAKPVRLAVGGEGITVPGGHSGPTVADWDGDGRHDLIVGCGDGSVQWFRSESTSGAPKLAAPVALLAGSTSENGQIFGTEPVCGRRVKVAVADWNADGKPDLLLGDWHQLKTRPADLAPEQGAELARLQGECATLDRGMAADMRRVQKQVFEKNGLDPESSAAAFAALSEKERARLDRALKMGFANDEALRTAHERQREIRERIEELGGKSAPHGFVSVMLRR